MKRYEHLRQKAIELRKERKSINEISEMLNKGKATIHYWIKNVDVVLGRTEKQSEAQKIGTKAFSEKCKKARDNQYNNATVDDFDKIEGLRDFILIYMCEGYRRSRNVVQVVNSNPNIVRLCNVVLKRLSDKKIEYNLSFYDDHNEAELKSFWSNELKVPVEQIRSYIKNGRKKLAGRNNASVNGTMQIRMSNTMLKSKIDGWMDKLQSVW